MEDLVFHEGHEQKIQIFRFADVFHAGVAKAERFALGVRHHGDFGGRIEADAEAFAGEALAESGVNLDLDDYSILGKAEHRLLGVDVAGGFGIAFEVIAAVGAAEELLLQGAFERRAAHAQLDGVAKSGKFQG